MTHQRSTAPAIDAEGDDLATASPDPAVRYLRKRLKGGIALAVRRGAQAAGVSYRQLGLAIDAPKSHVGSMASADGDKVIDAVRARLAPAEVAAEVARFVVEPHRKLVVDAPTVIECSEAERTCRLTRESLDLVTVRAEHLRDGALDLAEAEAELRECREAIAVQMEHEAHLVALIAKLRGER